MTSTPWSMPKWQLSNRGLSSKDPSMDAACVCFTGLHLTLVQLRSLMTTRQRKGERDGKDAKSHQTSAFYLRSSWHWRTTAGWFASGVITQTDRTERRETKRQDMRVRTFIPWAQEQWKHMKLPVSVMTLRLPSRLALQILCTWWHDWPKNIKSNRKTTKKVNTVQWPTIL